VLFVSSFVLVLAAPLVVRLVAPGFSGETYEIAVVMSRILLPGLMFMGLSGLSAGVLHTKKNFVTPAIVAFPSNLIIIVGAVFFGVRYGIVGLAWATIVGIASQFLIQLPAVARTGVFTRDKLLWKHPGLKKMAVLLPPVLLGGAALELKSIIDRVFGSLLPEGSIAALNFSNRIYLLPHSILILALLTVIYPTLVELHVEAKVKEFKETLRQGIGLMIVSITPMMAGLIVLRVPVVRLLFERGAFDVAATESTAFALAFYSLGLVGVGWQLLMNRAFYAMKDTVTPMVVTLVLVVMNIVFNWFLIKPLGHGGIALGTALSINVGTVLVWYLLRKKIGPFGGGRIVNTLWKSVLASAGDGCGDYYGHGLPGRRRLCQAGCGAGGVDYVGRDCLFCYGLCFAGGGTAAWFEPGEEKIWQVMNGSSG
jgi:putative peptidoglycan lipid II flippase